MSLMLIDIALLVSAAGIGLLAQRIENNIINKQSK